MLRIEKTCNAGVDAHEEFHDDLKLQHHIFRYNQVGKAVLRKGLTSLFFILRVSDMDCEVPV